VILWVVKSFPKRQIGVDKEFVFRVNSEKNMFVVLVENA
jgi:hypothetical protein